jgi:nitroreductase
MTRLPAENEVLPLPSSNPALKEVLATRRSTKVIHLTGPGPDAAEVEAILRVAMRVPDHGKIGPWRFVVIAGERRSACADMMALCLAASSQKADQAQLEAERARWLRAPVVVTVISSPVTPHKIPVWEQELSVGALCLNVELGAHAAGWGACWLTGWNAYDAGVASALGLREGERIAGFISIGTASEPPVERVRPDPASRIAWY